MTINKEIDNGLILLSTFPDEESLIDLSKTLIKDKKLCACVNYARINSLYMWKNDLKQESEFLALYKTTSKCVEQLKTEILKKHPYEMPEVVILTMKDVSHGYLNWLIDSTKQNNDETQLSCYQVDLIICDLFEIPTLYFDINC